MPTEGIGRIGFPIDGSPAESFEVSFSMEISDFCLLSAFLLRRARALANLHLRMAYN